MHRMPLPRVYNVCRSPLTMLPPAIMASTTSLNACVVSPRCYQLSSLRSSSTSRIASAPLTPRRTVMAGVQAAVRVQPLHTTSPVVSPIPASRYSAGALR